MPIKDTLAVAAMVGQVTATVALERLGPAPRLDRPGAVPPRAEAITAEWLTRVLCTDAPGAAVTDFRVLGGSDGTSSRRAIEVTYNAAGQAAGLPTRLFSKAAAGLFSRLLLGLTDIAEGEALFYNHARPALTVRSPRAFHAGFDPRTRRSLVLLEDLSVDGWTFPDPQDNTVTRADAEDMVAQLAAYHGAFWDSPRFHTDLAGLKPARRWQDALDRRAGFRSRTLRGFDRAHEVLPAGMVGRRAELYPAFHRSLDLHDASPQTLLHQDLHLGNWLRDRDGRMGLYDWQCVARGHWALDYSYAMAGALRPEDRREWEEDLLRLYLSLLGEVGVDAPSFDEAWLAYRQQPMHAFAFGLFTLGGSRLEPELQPRDYTLAAIGRIATFLDDHATLDTLSD
ncbi:putative aminoglycoside phosphotransferase [Nocardioides sp. J9]|uniref:phosphotransferase n=1 Tax=Nocardioides sp. J9 TaxID=935844 RepID=UPI0011A8428F|nr:phosphotransferase [Nocardioides sp. J9]TWG91688.1 putative aminoglycoside phosphotransferase [Nocardioides sp. J9]